MAEVNEKFVFIFILFFKFQHLCVVCIKSGHLSNLPNKKQCIILIVASKHFGHVMFYAADVESGLMHSKVGKNFYCLYWTHACLLCYPPVASKLG